MSPIRFAFRYLLRWFCHPTDRIEVKRSQCVYICVVSCLLLGAIANMVTVLASGTFFLRSIIPNSISLLLFSSLLIYGRYQRRPGGCRVLFVALLYYNIHILCIRGGFVHVPMVAFIGLLAPIMSLFMNASAKESAFWFAAHFALNLGVLTLQLLHQLPTIELSFKSTMVANLGSLLQIQILYSCIFALTVHIYDSEVETRRTLTKEMGLFTRLSHEIRTPISVITGMAELMQDWNLSVENRCIVSDLAGAARRLGTVVNDLISFSELPSESEKEVSVSDKRGVNSVFAHESTDIIAEDLLEFNIREAVDTVIGYHLPEAEASKTEIYVDIPAGLPTEVKGSRSRLIGILDHVVGNAVKFTQQGSVTIQVCLQEAVVGEDANFHDYEFIVRDTGVGMDAQELLHVFEPFGPRESLSNTEFSGMGIGLALAQQLAQRWGRSICASSEGRGRGSMFSFKAPLIVCCSVLSPRPNRMSVKLLVVHEDPKAAAGMLQMCSLMGVSSDVASFQTVTPEQCRAVDGVIVLLPVGFASGTPGLAMSPQNSNGAEMKEIVERIVADAKAMFICGPLSAQDWIAEELNVVFLRKPPSFAQLSTAVRSLWQPSAAAIRRAPAIGSSPAHSRVIGRTFRCVTGSNSTTPRGRVPSWPALPGLPPQALVNREGATPPGPSKDSQPELDQNSLAIDPLPQPNLANSANVPPPAPNPPAPRLARTMSRLATLIEPSNVVHPSPESAPDKPLTARQLSANELPPTQPSIFILETETKATMVVSESVEISSPLRILACDDNPIILKLLTAFIRKTGFSGIIDAVTVGEEALSKILYQDRAYYSLVMIDFNMPGIDGADVVKRIREMGFSMPIIGITAATDMKQVCLSSGMTEVISKPFSFEIIRDLLARYLG